MHHSYEFQPPPVQTLADFARKSDPREMIITTLRVPRWARDILKENNINMSALVSQTVINAARKLGENGPSKHNGGTV